MAGSLTVPSSPLREGAAESRQVLPAEVAHLLAAKAGAEADLAWAAFLTAYSPVLLKVASTFAPGYDGALDRYAYMLDEIRRGDCRRLRGYSADGRGRFSTWLAVVARRLCLDHYRQRYGRDRGASHPTGTPDRSRAARRGLVDLFGAPDELCSLADTSRADPADEVDARTQHASLHRAIDALCPGDRLLVRLRFEQELTAREIAPLLGLPSPFHVYRRLDRVCGELRARLTGGPETSDRRAPPGSATRLQAGGRDENLRPVQVGHKSDCASHSSGCLGCSWGHAGTSRRNEDTQAHANGPLEQTFEPPIKSLSRSVV